MDEGDQVRGHQAGVIHSAASSAEPAIRFCTPSHLVRLPSSTGPRYWRLHHELAKIEKRAGMLIVMWNGRRTVITGWRAWLIAGSAALLGAVVSVAAILLLFGAVLTLGLVL